jgi:hypothetical protein
MLADLKRIDLPAPLANFPAALRGASLLLQRFPPVLETDVNHAKRSSVININPA